MPLPASRHLPGVLREGELDDRHVEVEVPPASPSRMLGGWPGEGSVQEMVVRVDKLFAGARGRGEKRKMKVRRRVARTAVVESSAGFLSAALVMPLARSLCLVLAYTDPPHCSGCAADQRGAATD
jgi:ATP-dependent protease HslVU (ClpYQ) ATPase subunit